MDEAKKEEFKKREEALQQKQVELQAEHSQLMADHAAAVAEDAKPKPVEKPAVPNSIPPTSEPEPAESPYRTT